MAETITIPSPSVFLSSPSLKPVKALPKTSPRRPPPATKAAARAQSTTTANGVTKRKQSKSRNGCITCKAKRLKCDETKPTCQQCARRSVACGGYKKDFKWRPFEEASFVGKPTVGKPKKATPPPQPEEIPEPARPASPALSDSSNVTIGNSRMLPEGLVPMPSASSAPAFVDAPFETVGELYPSPTQDAIPFMLPPDQMPLDAPFDPDSAPSTICVFDDRDAEDTLRSATTAPSSLSSDQSPRLVDLLLPPAPDADPTSPEYLAWRAQYPDPIYQPVPFDPAMESMPLPMDAMEEDDVEEVVREPVVLNPDHEAWVMRLPSPSPTSSSSSGSSDSSHFFSAFLREPIFDASSPEMLTRRYDRETCGILSVKDGPTENPWRTLVWPLARDCPALYHAIASMTCFHSSRSQPNLRIHGIDHMRTAVHTLAGGLQNMRIDAAIATTLVLAFAESWDQHTSTGINHIKGAKILINQALVRQRNVNTVSREELERLRFLCNTWIYMDVIARITSVDDDESNDFEIVSSLLSDPSDLETQLDPLMGCASTLFPIIGRTANLVRRVCRSPSSTGNSPATISQAMDLKQQLENWVPPAFFEQPEDPTSLVVHSLQTAEAYRWATLLYLHQAVPEIPSLPSAELAKKVMVYLATVPPSSRAVIVQIYPLTAAGCEALGEDRDWVCQRWDGMAARMGLGIIDRCKEVTREVWDRRDAWRAERAERERARRLGKRKESLSMAEVSAVAAAAAAAAAAASAAQESENGQSLGMDLGMGMQMPMVKSEAKSELGIDDEAFSAWMEATGFAASAAAAAAAASSKRRSMSGLMSESKRIKAEKKAKKEMGMGGGGMGMEVLEPEFTVRGRLHWIGVMKDWKWEVLLG